MKSQPLKSQPLKSPTEIDPLPGLLARHAAATPQASWLFARATAGDHGWRWQSWSQVADRVARAAATLEDELGERSGARVGFQDRLDPDAVAARLAILAAGALPVGDEESTENLDAWLGPAPAAGISTDAETPVIELPAVLSRLSRSRPVELPLPSAAGQVAPPPWSAVLASDRPASPKWHVWRFFTERWRGRHRPLVVASALLSPAARRALLAQVLADGAAWALEPDPDAFVPAVLWTRPTVVVGPGAELGLLALAFGRGAARRARRLRAVLVSDGASAEIVEEGAWREIGVTVLRPEGVREPGSSPG